jgi:hypothetical protein
MQPETGFDLDKALVEFSHLKRDAEYRNREYWLLRNAYRDNFRWPRDWPNHIPRVTKNFCRGIVNRHTAYLMGKGFNFNVERPNTLEYRQHAERAEKILKKIHDLSAANIQFMEGARTGSKFGRTIFKVYKKGMKGSEHACFSYAQPDYFYGVSAGADAPGDFSIVYYSYPIDKFEATRRFGPGDYKSEAQLAEYERYITKPEDTQPSDLLKSRKIPVLEIWSKDNYALTVGGITKYNGKNPYRWSDTKEGFIPFVVIENIRADEVGYGEPDIKEARVLNEHYNYLVSRRNHVVERYLTPTVTWEGAPQNAAEIISNTLGGGGLIPTRLGSRIGFLVHDRPNPSVSEQLAELRTAIIESGGLNEASYQGEVTGSINTGPALSVQFFPALATIEQKQMEWTQGLRRLHAMLLQVQEDIGATKALGEAVVNQRNKTADLNPVMPGEEEELPGVEDDGELVRLSGKDINGLRDVSIHWPGVLPADDQANARLEIEKFSAGLQSVYTTMEKLGEEYPDDEIARIRIENQDPSLRGEKVAEQTRANMPLMKQAMEGQGGPPGEMPMDPAAMAGEVVDGGDPMAAMGAPDPAMLEEPGIGGRMRQLAMSQRQKLNMDEDDLPILEQGAAGY